MELVLPNNYIEIEEEEMMYFMAGMYTKFYFWGYSIFITPQEIKEIDRQSSLKGVAATVLFRKSFKIGLVYSLSSAIIEQYADNGYGMRFDYRWFSGTTIVKPRPYR